MTKVRTVIAESTREALGLFRYIQRVLNDVFDERTKQLVKWGEQRRQDGTDPAKYSNLAEAAKKECDAAEEEGGATWRQILLEEVLEAFSETDKLKLRKELVQVAAVATCWVEDIDKRAEDEAKEKKASGHVSPTWIRYAIMAAETGDQEALEELRKSSDPQAVKYISDYWTQKAQ